MILNDPGNGTSFEVSRYPGSDVERVYLSTKKGRDLSGDIVTRKSIAQP